MRSLSSQMTAWVFTACAFFMLIAAGVGAVGALGVREATDAGNRLTHDELATATLTNDVSRAIDSAYTSGRILPLTTVPARHVDIARTLSDSQIPAIETGLADLVRTHAGDDAAERADIQLLVDQWTALRGALNAQIAAAASTTDASVVTARYAPINAHLQRLSAAESADAVSDQRSSSARSSGRIWLIGAAVALATLAGVIVGWVGSRRLRRAVEPAQVQVDFADTLQLAEDEDEAHRLLQRHLERLLDDASVIVLNRNNSADRLEAVTELPPDSPLVPGLAGAEPRSCLAVRSGRVHQGDDQRLALLACPVCSACPGKTTCSPLTVGGEVIGSVLVNRPATNSPIEHQQIRDSVGQAAPVLANLRNLAIAEIRAATDSLTGLPNKRAVADTLKRMLAQASRTLTPLSLLMLDLDHFKDINDRFGHPVGDQALANVGAALRSALRDSDFAGRNGGEEFAILLPNTDTHGAMVTADKVRAAIAEISLTGFDVSITASVGLASYPEHATSPERLERLADSALYVAKRSGRDRIEIASPLPDPAVEASATGSG